MPLETPEAAPPSADAATVAVDLGARSYRIEIGAGLLAEAGRRLAPLLARPRVAVVTDVNVARLHLPALKAALAAEGIEIAATVAVPPGESSKSWESLGRVLDRLLDARVERDDVILAFGGGVVGDLAGVAGALLRRGVRVAQIPTTLLAQVDSSVGGKTGVNARQGKNLIGAFHQPAHVLADVDLLATLPGREFLAGYAETAKYGLLGDATFFGWLEANGPALAAGDAALRIEAVRRACAMKAAIVARDETETGERALLNLGHTFGHALEAATGYSDRLLHGEAVAVGIGLAFDLSARLGLCPQEAPSRVAEHFAAMGLRRRVADVPGPLPDAEGLLALMAQDKKAKGGRVAYVLARDVGDAFVSREAPEDAVRAVLAEALAARR